jgi:hypothetical protein
MVASKNTDNPVFEVCGQMSHFFLKRMTARPLAYGIPTLSALATIHFPNTSSILVIMRSAH